MSTTTQPAYGHEKFMLRPPKRRGGKHRLVREIFTDTGFSHVWNEDAKDWESWSGSYKEVETLGEFETPEEAAKFLTERASEARDAA
jgi:hypothetical protein